MLRIGRIDYANCTPLFMQIEEQLPENTEIVHGVPAALNSRLADGDIDLCISSSIEFSRHSREYSVLPGHCIGSDGPVQSVLLFGNKPVTRLENQRILVTSESATSIILLQILLKKHWGLSGCRIVTTSSHWSEALAEADGLLLIGDSALKAAASGASAFCYDLGHEWKAMTGLPFVYALWLVNCSAAAGKQKELKLFATLLEQARDNIALNAAVLAGRAPESQWLGQKQLEDYWLKAITYRLDESHLAGLELFYALAMESGLIQAAPEIHFHDYQS